MDGKPTREIFPGRVQEARLAAGYTQEALARELGISWVTVSRWERGENEPPLSMLRRLASALGVQPSELLEERAA